MDAVADPDDDAVSTRKLYTINPLNGQFDLVMDLGDGIVSADVTPEGRIFAIDVAGAAVPGTVYEVNVVNQNMIQEAV